MKKQNFLTGALILGISSVFVRMIGFVFRVYLSNAIGPEGMGVYSLIMSVYGLAITLCTAGMGITVSRLVAEQLSGGAEANARQILRRAAGLAGFVGAMVAAALWGGADMIADRLLHEARAAMPLKILAVGLPFLSVSSCIRGYFVARRQVGNPATAQLLEQGIKMAFIVALLGRYLPRGIEAACTITVLGITIGEGGCFIYSALGYALSRSRAQERREPGISGVSGKILAAVAPIATASYTRAFLRLAEDVLIMAGLRAFSGGAGGAATSAYGILKGMVIPLLTFPLMLLSSFIITLTPEISRLKVSGRTRQMESGASQILQYTAMAGILVVAVFMTFSYEIGLGVYKSPQVGEILRQLSFLCPFMCLESVVVSILQGLGEQVSTMRYSLLDCALRIALISLLVPLHGTGGFMWMVIASNLFTSFLNIRRLLQITKIRFDFRLWILRPVLAALACSQAARLLGNCRFMQRLAFWPNLAASILAASVVYGILMLWLGCLERDTLHWLWEQLRQSQKVSAAKADMV